MRIFNPWGGIVAVPYTGITGPAVYCTMLARSSKQSGASAALSSLLTVKAPLSGINVTARVDVSADKGLDGDFLLSTFGYAPARIVLSGLSIVGRCLDGSNSRSNVYSYYRKWNVHADKSARIDLVIDGKRAYRCVLLSCDLKMPGRSDMVNTATYTLEFWGAQL
jgi:hypothetical protein